MERPGELSGYGRPERGSDQEREESFAGASAATSVRKGMGKTGDSAPGSGAGQAMREEARQIGEEVGGELKHYVQDAAHRGKNQIAERLHHVSKALDRAGDTLENEEEAQTGQYAHKAARQIDRVCEYLEEHEPADMIHMVDRFARRQPAVFIGGALIAGVVLGRFLRSTQAQHPGSMRDDYDEFESDRQFRERENAGSTFGQPSGRFGEPTKVGVAGTGRIEPGAGRDMPIGSRPLTEPPRPGELGRNQGGGV